MNRCLSGVVIVFTEFFMGFMGEVLDEWEYAFSCLGGVVGHIWEKFGTVERHFRN